mmetsp:Transcript_19187/g.31462  ORF Transcript_19187/g.31462 Transcript_19187/m.31462 type:complete len:603 (-) Transcript_19187:20-1828(-)
MGCCESKDGASHMCGEVVATLDTYNGAAMRFRNKDTSAANVDKLVNDVIAAACSGGDCDHSTRGISLTFQNQELGARSCLAIAEIVSRQCNVRSLSLIECGVTHNAATEIGRGLRSNLHLECLDLSGNLIDSRGVRGLLKYIRSNRTLLELSLANCSLDECCANIIANSLLLSENSTLRRLDLSNNGLNDRGIECLARSISSHTSLIHVDVSGNGGKSPALGNHRRVASNHRCSVPPEEIVSWEHEEEEQGILPFNASQELMKAVTERNYIVMSILREVVDSLPVDLNKGSGGGYCCGKFGRVGCTTGPKDHPPTIHEKEPHEPELGLSGVEINVQDYPGTDALETHTPPRCTFGYADMQGRRQRMEDVVLMQRQFCQKPDEHLFGIFDGHGGPECANFVKSCFPKLLEQELRKIDPIGDGDEKQLVHSCMLTAFKQMQHQITKLQVSNGSCVIIAYLRKDAVYIVSLGDSRALILNKGGPNWLSDIMSPRTESERERIEANGGFVTDNGRVCGVLAVSRAFGDIQYSDMISAVPVVSIHKVSSQTGWVVLGCDGVWDVLDGDEIDSMLTYVSCPMRAARVVRDAAYRQGSTDNISVICIKP